jgi:spermidine synthase
MDNSPRYEAGSNSSLWIENLVNGLAGITLRAKHAIHYVSSPFQKIEIFHTYAFGKVLVLADNIVLTERDEYIYHEAIVQPALNLHNDPRRVCIIGGGDGGCLREVLKHKKVESALIVEIDKQVKDAVIKHFPQFAAGFSDPRAKAVFAEGYSFLEKTKDTFDVIIVDSYDPGGPVQSLETAGFYKLVHQRLDKGGIAVFQTDSPTIRSEFLRSTVATISSLFSSYRPYTCTIPSFPEGICSFVLSAKEGVSLDADAFNEKRFAAIASRCLYYNPEIHRGAFMLPEYIRKIVA